jgi:Aspartyl protease
LTRLLLVLLLMLPSISGWCDAGKTTVNLSIFFSNDPCNDFKTLIIPIRRVQNLIVVEARIDTIVGNFILDTGAPYLVLNKTYFRNGRQLEDKIASNANGTSAEPVIRTNVSQLALKDLYFEDIQADLSDLGHIENHRGIKILGLLGVSLFTSFEMVIDLYKGELYLHKTDRNGVVPEEERIVRSNPLLRIPFQLTDNVITVDGSIGGNHLTFCLDTGAETNTLSNLLPNKVLRSFHVTKRMVLLGMSGSRSEILLGTLDEFSLGNQSYRNSHVAITRLDALSQAYGRKIDGILGNNFLVKGIISINFISRELCMYPFDVRKP